MIIGISGKIGSGKDTVGQIIQYLTKPEGANEFTLEDYMTDSSSYLYAGNNWENRKFADELKDTVCRWIGCTREQLEDREFKEAELGEEWRVWKNLNTYDQKVFSSEEELKNVYQWLISPENGDDIVSEILTPRKILQLLGTNCGRDIIHPNIWVNSLMSNYKWDGKSMTDGWVPSYNDPDNSGCYPMAEPIMPNWLITDTRFPNEAEAILSKGGILIRVNRGDGNTGDHPSETSLDNYDKFTYTIDNNGTIEDLVEKVREILIKEKLI